MALQLEEYLPALEESLAIGDGRPLLLPIDLIDEDPAQPRLEFDSDALAELAATIAMRGVRQPVSVRRHPAVADRWMLNFGARRLRASRLAGMADIPAFVDEAADSYDQVIENEQRQALRPLDLALFVDRQLKFGQTKAEIARRLGKSGAYLTYVCSLIDAPDWLLELYRSGRCRGLRELYEVRRLVESHPEVLVELQDVSLPMPREALLERRRQTATREPPKSTAIEPTDGMDKPPARGLQGIEPEADEASMTTEPKTSSKGPKTSRREDVDLRISCRISGKPGCLVLSSVPRSTTGVFVILEGESALLEVSLDGISDLAVVRPSQLSGSKATS